MDTENDIETSFEAADVITRILQSAGKQVSFCEDEKAFLNVVTDFLIDNPDIYQVISHVVDAVINGDLISRADNNGRCIMDISVEHQ